MIDYYLSKCKYLLVLLICLCFTSNIIGQTITQPSSGTSSATITCGTTYTYYDPAGTSSYGSNQSSVYTLNPSVAGQFVRINFGTGGFNIETCGGASCTCDFIRIYDGTTTGATLIGKYCSGNRPGIITSTTGSLTVEWSSDAFTTASGWVAEVTCEASSTTPTAIFQPTSGSTSQTITCGTNYVYYDPGGYGNYSNNQLSTLTLNPSTVGQMVEIDFTTGWNSIEDCGGAGCDCDWIKIYDGTTTGATLINTYCDGNQPGVITSTTGSLTIEFDSDGGTRRAGYYAYISCFSPCATVAGTAAASVTSLCAGNTSLSLSGEDPAATIQWQVSTDGGSTWANISGATTDPWVQAVSVNSMYQALVTNGCTATSNSVSVTVNCPDIIQTVNGTTVTTNISCGGSYNFYDSGGSGSNHSNDESGMTIICPSTVGQYVSVDFTSFSLENNFDYLYIFDGSATTSNLIGAYTGTMLNGLTITASSANTTGCLSFRMLADPGTTDAGWEALVTCTGTPAAPYATPGIEDCHGASVICSDAALTGGTTGFGRQELPAEVFAPCIFFDGENESQWYVFSSTTPGTIGFEIVPASPTDYDWAIWGPYTTLDCPVFTADLPIRCNATQLIANGNTGLVAGATDTIEENGNWAGEVTDADCKPLTVLAGEIYIMMLDNWSTTGIGFQLNWSLTNSNLDCNPPLPVTLTSYTSHCQDNKTLLKWSTSSEINNNFFIIEKANDDFVFSEIGKVFGSGSSSMTQEYQFIDPESNAQTAYYRLVQIDFNGDAKYHRIVASHCENEGFKVTKSHLTQNNLNLVIKSGNNENIRVNIYNSTGKLIYNNSETLQTGENSINCRNLNISSGIYLVSIVGDVHKYSTKLLRK